MYIDIWSPMCEVYIRKYYKMLKLSSFLLLFAFLSSSNLALAQDYIVPEKGDTIKCYITRIKRDTIYYKFRDTDMLIKNNTISVDSVNTYDIEYYEVYDKIVEEKPQKEKNIRFGIGFGMGWSHRIGKLHPYIPEDKESEYKNGFYLRGNVGLYIKDVGFGFMLNQHQTHALILDNDVTTKITFIAPYFEVQSKPINDLFRVVGYLAIGTLKFEEKVTPSPGYFYTSALTNKGSGTGVGFGGSFVLLLSVNVNLAIDAGVISGIIPDGDIIDKNGDIIGSFEDEGASSFTLGIKLRILL